MVEKKLTDTDGTPGHTLDWTVDQKLDAMLGWTSRMVKKLDIIAEKLVEVVTSQEAAVRLDHELRNERDDFKHLRELQDSLSYKIFSEAALHVVTNAQEKPTAETWRVLAQDVQLAVGEFMRLRNT